MRYGSGFMVTGSGLVASGHADLLILFAPVDERIHGFLLEAKQPGFALAGPFRTVGRRGADLWQVELRGCIVPGERALGGLHPPAHAAFAAVERAWRIGEAAAAVGLAQAAFEAALRYSQQRSAFGVPICQHQAIQLKLADMATRIAVARLLTQRAAAEDGAGATATMHAHMAHLQASETAAAVTLEAMRIHGGYGYTAEFPVERYYRDAAMLMAAETGHEDLRDAIARRVVASSRAHIGAP